MFFDIDAVNVNEILAYKVASIMLFYIYCSNYDIVVLIEVL